MREQGEFARIRDIVAALAPGHGVIVGPGDDAAVLRPAPGRDLVVTTDTFVEGRHFRAGELAGTIGHRLAAANLSDIAAMAAAPRWALVSCVAPAAADPAWLRATELACAAALETDGAAVVGGNLAASEGPIAWTVTLVGDVAEGAHWTRAGARDGDVLAASGPLGRAAAALALSAAGEPALVATGAHGRALAERWAAPPSRVALAAALAATGGVRAAMDVSDGLAGDLAHLCAASGVGAVVRERPFAGDAALVAAARALGLAGPEALAFAPGDDYELLLAIDPARWDDCRAAAARAGAPLVELGEFTAARALEFERSSGVREGWRGAGWSHFA